MDTTCSWCGEPWEVYGLRHDGWDYIGEEQALSLGVSTLYWFATQGDSSARRTISQAVYMATLSGKGCPSVTCGFNHQPGAGPYREQQLTELVFDGITDDDPALFF